MKHCLILLACISLFAACDKNNDIVIDDPQIDMSEFDTIAVDTINGYLFQDCFGTPAPDEIINISRIGQSFGEYMVDEDTIYSDANGYFKYVWTVLNGDESGANNVGLMGFIPSTGQTIFFNGYDAGDQFVEFSLTDSTHMKVHFSFLSPYTSLDTLWYDKYYGAAFGATDAGYITGPFSDTSIYLPDYPSALDYFSNGQLMNYLDYGISFSQFYQTHITVPDPHKIQYFHGGCSPLDSISIVVD